MMNAILKQKWDFTVEYYEELAISNKAYSELRSLVNKLALSKYAEIIHPSVSVGHLNLSINENYEDSNSNPTISIKRSSDAQFIIYYATNPKNTNSYEKRICSFLEVWGYLESLLLRLEIETSSTKRNE